MSKVIFEFDEDEDRIEIENIMKRDNFIYALEKIREYRRKLSKGYINNEIIVKDRAEMNIIQEWYKYRDEQYKEIAIDWCKQNKLEYK